MIVDAGGKERSPTKPLQPERSARTGAAMREAA